MSGGTRLLAMAALALLLIVGLMALLIVVTDDGAGIVQENRSAVASYLAVFLLIAGDAVVPVLPGETTLNAASVLASGGTLDLGIVIVAGGMGAIIGDSALYWLARASRSRVQRQLDRLQDDARVRWVIQLLGRRGAMLIVFGRYIPGVRFFVNASMGMLPLPYPRFLLWSVIGGAIWSTYTCLLAYAVGSALEEYPLATIIISGAVTTALIAAIYWLDVRRSGGDNDA